MCRCSNQSTLYARTITPSLHIIGSFLRFLLQVEHNASLFQYVLCLLRNTVANIARITLYSKFSQHYFEHFTDFVMPIVKVATLILGIHPLGHNSL